MFLFLIFTLLLFTLIQSDCNPVPENSPTQIYDIYSGTHTIYETAAAFSHDGSVFVFHGSSPEPTDNYNDTIRYALENFEYPTTIETDLEFYVPHENRGGRQREPGIVFLDNGAYVLTYSATQIDSDGSKSIFAEIFQSRGGGAHFDKVKECLAIAQTAPCDQSGPSIASINGDEFVVGWIRYQGGCSDPNPNRVGLRKFDSFGNPLTNDTYPVPDQLVTQEISKNYISASTINNRVLITYRWENGGQFELYGTLYDGDLNEIKGHWRIIDDDIAAEVSILDIDEGFLIVGVSTTTGLNGIILDKDGNELTSLFNIDDDFDMNKPSLAKVNENTFVVTYSNDNVFMKLFDIDGNLLADRLVVDNDTESRNPIVLVPSYDDTKITVVYMRANGQSSLPYNEHFGLGFRNFTLVNPPYYNSTIPDTEVDRGDPFNVYFDNYTLISPEGSIMEYTGTKDDGDLDWVILQDTEPFKFYGTAPSSKPSTCFDEYSINLIGFDTCRRRGSGKFTLKVKNLVPSFNPPDNEYEALNGEVRFIIPQNTFIADPIHDTSITFTSEVPEWLSFEPDERKYFGTAPDTVIGECEDSYQINVTGTDACGRSSDTSFLLYITKPGPIKTKSISNQEVNVGQDISFSVGLDLFDDNVGSGLTYTSTMSDDSPLPSWLNFYPNLLKYNGTAESGCSGAHEILIKAEDSCNNFGEALFILNIQNDAPFATEDLEDKSYKLGETFDFDYNPIFLTPETGEEKNFNASISEGGDLPNWLIHNNGRFNGTVPNNNCAETFLIEIVMSDSCISSTTKQLFAFDIINEPPEYLGGLSDKVIIYNENFTYDVSKMFSNKESIEDITWTLENVNEEEQVPAWVSIDQNGKIHAHRFGDAKVQLRVKFSDSCYYDTGKFYLTVVKELPYGDDDDDDNTSTILAAVFGSIGGIAAIAGVFLLVRYKRGKKRREMEDFWAKQGAMERMTRRASKRTTTRRNTEIELEKMD